MAPIPTQAIREKASEGHQRINAISPWLFDKSLCDGAGFCAELKAKGKELLRWSEETTHDLNMGDIEDPPDEIYKCIESFKSVRQMGAKFLRFGSLHAPGYEAAMINALEHVSDQIDEYQCENDTETIPWVYTKVQIDSLEQTYRTYIKAWEDDQ